MNLIKELKKKDHQLIWLKLTLKKLLSIKKKFYLIGWFKTKNLGIFKQKNAKYPKLIRWVYKKNQDMIK